MKSLLTNIYNRAKLIVLKALHLLEFKWIKISIITALLIFSVYYILDQYISLKESISNLTLNIPLLVFSSLIFLITVFLSVYSWKNAIFAFGFNFPWIDIAHAQMLSMLGKYIPGHVWNYSSKIYLSHKFGMPIKLSASAVIIEMVITYSMAVCLFFIVSPMEIFDISSNWILVIRVLGLIILALLFFSPLLLSKYLREKAFIKSPYRLIAVLLIRAVLWVISSYAFILLILSMGYPNIGIINAISAITLSFFIGFIAIFVPDGLFVREASIIFLLKNILSTADATLISLIFRFQLVLVEFSAVLIALLMRKIFNNQVKK